MDQILLYLCAATLVLIALTITLTVYGPVVGRWWELRKQDKRHAARRSRRTWDNLL